MKIEPRPKKDPDPLSKNADDSKFIVNPPFRGTIFASNKKLEEDDWVKLEKTISQEEKLLFVIVGDLSISSKYAKSFLAVTDRLIYGFDDAFEGGVKTHSYDKVKRAFVKRYYGNAMLVFSMDDADREYVDLTREYTNFIRFSYKVTSLYDAAAIFIQNVAAGKDMEEELRVVQAAFEKQFCVCPKCGRALIRPGAACMNCQSKNKIWNKSWGQTVLPRYKIFRRITKRVSLDISRL